MPRGREPALAGPKHRYLVCMSSAGVGSLLDAASVTLPFQRCAGGLLVFAERLRRLGTHIYDDVRDARRHPWSLGKVNGTPSARWEE